MISDGDEDKKVLDYLRAEEPYGSLELSSAGFLFFFFLFFLFLCFLLSFFFFFFFSFFFFVLLIFSSPFFSFFCDKVYGSLKLSIKGLNTIPKEVYEYTNLTKLDLTHNNLTSFPPICDGKLVYLFLLLL